MPYLARGQLLMLDHKIWYSAWQSALKIMPDMSGDKYGAGQSGSSTPNLGNLVYLILCTGGTGDHGEK